MDHLEIYEKVRKVPQEAQKSIQGGRLKGMTDINPMWRIKALTEQFGLCGFGWVYEITKQWTETGANGEIAAFCNINLLVKIGNEWSAAIPGTGGSSYISNEKNGLYTSDECFKMALTDALSVACKALGVGADVYWEKDNTKYDKKPDEKKPEPKKPEPPKDEIQPSDLEKRATAIYFLCTGNKEGQLKWTKEAYNAQLKAWKDEGHITTSYGKNWTLQDILWIEGTLEPMPF